MSSNHNLGVIFDMDGVLIDSYHAHFESWRQMTAAEGLAITEEQFQSTFGRTSRESIRQLWGRELPDAKVAALDEEKERLFREIIGRKFPAMPGAVELLEALCAAGFVIALGSSGPPPNVDLSLDRLGTRPLFAAVVTGQDVSRGKPDPQVFMIAAARLQIPPQRCAVVEDAAVGIEAARRADAAAIGLASTGRTRQQLRAADLVVDRLAELSPKVIEDVIRRHLQREA